MNNSRFCCCLVFVCALGFCVRASAQADKPAAVHSASASNVYPLQQGFVDSNGVMIYYKMLGRGAPLLIGRVA